MFWVALIALFIWVGWKIGKLESRVRIAEHALAQLSQARGAEPEATASPAAAGPSQPAMAPVPEVERPTPTTPRPVRPSFEPTLVPATPAAATATSRPAPAPRAPAAPSRLRERWKPLERMLIENWTGILGAVLLVAGVAFLGIYTALWLGPALRCAMIVGGAAVLAGLWVLLREREPWGKVALWLRSSAAAVFLFACFGAGAIPGLRWIDATSLALTAILCGIGVNLLLAFAGRTQAFASLHVILSLIPLAIVPPSELSFGLGAAVTLFGVALCYRERWDVHLLLTLAGFGAFHVDWLMGMSPLLADSARLTGACGALAVGAAAGLVHYRKEYGSLTFARLPFGVHLANWAMLGAVLSYYSRETTLRGIALFAAAGVAWSLSRRAKRIGVRWAHLTDTLVAQGFALGGIVAFYPWIDGPVLVWAALFGQAALFTRVLASEHEPLLTRIGVYMLHAGAALICFVSWSEVDGPRDTQNAVVLLGVAALATLRHVTFVRTFGERFDGPGIYSYPGRPDASRLSLLGLAIGGLVASALFSVHDSPGHGLLAFVTIGVLICVANLFSSRGLAAGAWGAGAAAFAIGWIEALGRPGPLERELAESLPLLALAALAVRWAPEDAWRTKLRALALYAGAAQLGLLGWLLFEPLSPLVPGVLWLVGSIAALEASRRAAASDLSSPLLHAGYAYVAAFLVHYALVGMQTSAYLGPIPARMAVELFAVATFGFWWLAPASPELARRRSWSRVQPWFLELALLFGAFALVQAVAPAWRPACWGILAITGLGAPRCDERASRMRAWALLLFWACAADLAFVTSGLVTPSRQWYASPAFSGVLTIGILIAFVLRAHPRLGLETVAFPTGLRALTGPFRRLDARTPWVVYYPFFAAVAVFLYGRFDHSVLTLLWAAEAFAVFVLAAVLRENHFRYLALAGLGACVARLVVYDLAQSGTLARGLVFLGVGVLMLAMNTIYARFKPRFE